MLPIPIWRVVEAVFVSVFPDLGIYVSAND